MATDLKISTLIEDQFPDFVREDGPKLVAFIKAYYEWLETTGQATDVSKNLLAYRDIDRTLDRFVDYFVGEIMKSLPDDILANKRLVAKQIQDLYKAKGSENAYKLLFRILFDEEIELFYPGTEILRVSDGRWSQQQKINLSEPSTGPLLNLGGRQIRGTKSGATARVLSVLRTNIRGIPVTECTLINIKGTFIDDEIIQTSEQDISGTIVGTIGPVIGLVILNGGFGHKNDDEVNIISSGTGSGATGIVTSLDETALTFEIKNGGNGYTNNSIISITGPVGEGAAFRITGIANTETIPFLVGIDPIEFLKDVTIGQGPTFGDSPSINANTNPTLAAANVFSTIISAFDFEERTFGTISSIETISPGFNYTIKPTVTVIEPQVSELNLPAPVSGFKGRNAVIVANTTPGAITSVRITTGGTNYATQQPVTLVNQSNTSATGNATAAVLTSGVTTVAGKYTDTKGFLSWNNKLQDSFFYQEFSYVIKSTKILKSYRDIVNKLLHPAGEKLFGQVEIFDEANLTSLTADVQALNFIYEIITHSYIPEVVIEIVDAIIPAPEIETEFIAITTLDGDLDLNIILEPLEPPDTDLSIEAIFDTEFFFSLEIYPDSIASVTIISTDANVVPITTIRPVGFISSPTYEFGQVPIELIQSEDITPYVSNTFVSIITFPSFGTTTLVLTTDAASVNSTVIISVPSVTALITLSSIDLGLEFALIDEFANTEILELSGLVIDGGRFGLANVEIT